MSNFSETSVCYDNTRLSDYKECPRKYYIRHVLHWRSQGTAIPLVFGLSWHDAMDVTWSFAKQLPIADLRDAAHAQFCETWEKNGLTVQASLADIDKYKPRTPGIAREMLHNYITQRQKVLTECELLAVEQPFAVPVPGMNNVWYVGRLDKVVDWNGKKVIEHKTTTAYATVGNFRTDFVDQWYSSSQVKGYEFAGQLYFPGLRDVWVDAALVHAKVHDAFKFIPVAHNFDLVSEWINTTSNWIKRVEAAHDAYDSEGVQAFQKNEDSCFGKYGTCPYLDICRACADPSKLKEVPPGYVEEKWEPFNVLKLVQLTQQGQQDNG